MATKNPAYRVVVVCSAGSILRGYRVAAESDQQAIESAKKHKQLGLALEVWKDGRFVHEFGANECFTEEQRLRAASSKARSGS